MLAYRGAKRVANIFALAGYCCSSFLVSLMVLFAMVATVNMVRPVFAQTVGAVASFAPTFGVAEALGETIEEQHGVSTEVVQLESRDSGAQLLNLSERVAADSKVAIALVEGPIPNDLLQTHTIAATLARLDFIVYVSSTSDIRSLADLSSLDSAVPVSFDARITSERVIFDRLADAVSAGLEAWPLQEPYNRAAAAESLLAEHNPGLVLVPHLQSITLPDGLTPIAVFSEERSPQFPEVLTALEQGFNIVRFFELDVIMPRETADGVAASVGADLQTAVGDPELEAALLDAFSRIAFEAFPDGIDLGFCENTCGCGGASPSCTSHGNCMRRCDCCQSQ